MLLEKSKTCVIIVNMQLELVPLLVNGTQLLNDCVWMADLCQDIEVPLVVIEQKKLGNGSEALKEKAGNAAYFEKEFFDMTNHEDIKQALLNTGAEQFVLCGGETHVCLYQSAMGLKALGKEVYMMADVCSARNQIDQDYGLERLSKDGVHLITKEMFFFELQRNSELPNYLSLALKFLDGRYIR